MKKDIKAVNSLYDKTHVMEFLFCDKLNKFVPEDYAKHGLFFQINVIDKFSKHDIKLIQISPEKEEKTLIRIEHEHAWTQHDWVDFFPPYWDGLHLLERKFRDKNEDKLDLFVKTSLNFKSLFAVDCRGCFVQKTFGPPEVLKKHSLGFETDNIIYNIDWNNYYKYKYFDNKYLKSSNKEDMKIVEENNDNEKWIKFFRFISRRFLPQIPWVSSKL